MSEAAGDRASVTFPWQETGAQIGVLLRQEPTAVGIASGRVLAAAGAAPEALPRLELPAVLPPARPGEPAADYAARIPARIGRQCVVLLQAGAAALGFWDEDELVRHRCRRRYVVRGHGKAQPTHLRTRGKSRYGSRLRLQNWRLLLDETAATLREWWDELGPPEQVFHAAPVRAWGDLHDVDLPPPFRRDDPGLQRVPFHVHRPDLAELERVRRRLARGRLVLTAPAAPA